MRWIRDVAALLHVPEGAYPQRLEPQDVNKAAANGGHPNTYQGQTCEWNLL